MLPFSLGMIHETFEILNEKEKALHGIIETAKPRTQQPVIILMNGFLDTMETEAKKSLAAALLKEGYVIVRFDYTYGFGQGSGEVSEFTLTNMVQDTERVIDHVMRRGYVVPEKIFLIGHCFGAMGAILLAAFDERVSGVVGLSTPYWFEDTDVTRLTEREKARMRLKRYFHLQSKNLGREVRIDYTFFEDGVKKDMARAVRNLQQPLLLIHGAQDTSIPLANAQEIYKRVPGEKELHVIENLAHNLSPKEITLILPFIRKFLKEHAKK